MKKNVLILGISSWIGSLLADVYRDNDFSVTGTVNSSQISFNRAIKIIKISNSELDRYRSVITSSEPTLIINLLRGEDVDGFELHKCILNLINKSNIHYIYASSVLALDGYKGVDLVESLDPMSISDYGLFKAQCELEIKKFDVSHTIIRFSSVQGWVPHKPTRNQSFLSKLQNNALVTVDTGIIQNRFLASKLVDVIYRLSQDRIQGVVHIGTSDSSEELYFLKKQAILFGYSEELVVAGKQRSVNLVAIPDRIYTLYDDQYRFTEDQTLSGLLKIEGLEKYRN